jgi:hypothetical protein
VISEFDVEFLTEVAGMSPEQGRIPDLFAIALSDVLRGWENPGNHRKVFGRFPSSKGQFENLLRREMEFPDDFFILVEKRIFA